MERKRVPDQTWPTARRSPLNDRTFPSPGSTPIPSSYSYPGPDTWIMADNASSEAVFSTTINADRSKQETWIQIASSGDLDLAVNGHIITLASSAAKGSKKLPHLAIPEASPPPADKIWAGGEGIEIPPTKQTAHPFNRPNSPPTTSVTGSRQGKMSSLRAFGASTSRPAFLPTDSSLRETKSIAFPPMPAGEWAINRSQNRALRNNTRSRLAKKELLPGVICPRTWPGLWIVPVLPICSNLGPSLA